MSEPDVSDLMTVQQAIDILDAAPVITRARRVKLDDAIGLRLAADVLADRDAPAFDKALMDGYAIHHDDVQLPALRLIGETRAGLHTDQILSRGQALSITTGAPLPQGADAVVPVEHTQRAPNGEIQITRRGDYTRFVTKRGEECRRGNIVLAKGTRLEAAQLAVAATVGAAELEVFDPPRIAVLATGDELVSPEQQPEPHQIRNSSSIMLSALLKRFNCSVIDLGIAKDDFNAQLEAIKSGLAYDALFISGGMSMGSHDLAPKVLEHLHAKFEITKLKIKPGKPFVFAHIENSATSGRCYIFGLPGNPLAGFVCAIRLASRLLKRMNGGTPTEDWIRASLAGELPANGPREFYQPAILADGLVKPLPWKGSADLFTLAKANVLLVRPENDPAQPAGASCKLLAIPT